LPDIIVNEFVQLEPKKPYEQEFTKISLKKIKGESGTIIILSMGFFIREVKTRAMSRRASARKSSVGGIYICAKGLDIEELIKNSH